MRRSHSVVQPLSSAAYADASAAVMSSRNPYSGGRSRGRGRGQRSFSDRPHIEAGRDQVMTGDSNFQSVQNANLGFQHGGRTEGPSNLDHRPSLRPIHFNNQGRHPRQPPSPQQFHQPQFDQNHVFRPPSLRNQWQPFHQPYRPSVNKGHAAWPPPPFYYQNQVSRPPPPQRHQPRSKPSDYREWAHAKTAVPPGSEKFVVLSYNILADYLANDHRGKLYYHIPWNLLSWESRKRRIMFELGLWSADIMCLQEVDRFQELEEELRFRGYSGIWKMRTGNAIDGCAIFWRSNRFKLVHEESIQFNKLGLRDNVAQICVLESLNSRTRKNVITPSERSADSHHVVICNIHVLYNPKRGEIKLGQVRTLLEKAHAISKLWDNAPVVLCGDFNCTPKSPLYNFILEQKLDLSTLARDKVSGQESAVIYPSRPKNSNPRFQSTNKSPQVQVRSLDSISDAQTENKSNRDVEKGPPGNMSELQSFETILVSPQATADSDQVLPGEQPGSDGTTDSKLRESDDNGYPFVAKDISSVSKSDPKLRHSSDAETHLIEEISETSIASLPEEFSHINFSKDEKISLGVSAEILEEKLDDLSLNEPDGFVKEGEGLGEDSETFLAAPHSDDSGHNGESGDVMNELPPELVSEAFGEEEIPYDPSSWTPMEIATATGDPEITTIKHSLQLTSTYTEVEGKTNTRDAYGEPTVTSYNRCFMGTVDYIWRSQGLQTVRVLAPMPKQAMQWTPGFPTPKWGSDHIALVSELVFCEHQSNHDDR